MLVGADKLTDGSVGLARRFGIPEIVIGLTVVAFGTSLPEFTVSFLAGVGGDEAAAALSVSNIVGSNLFNTLVIVGVSAAVCPIVLTKTTVRNDIPLCLLASLVLGVLALDDVFYEGAVRNISRRDGLLLTAFFLIFLSYTIALAWHRNRHKAETADTLQHGDAVGTSAAEMSVVRILLYIIVGFAGLIGVGELFVDGACGIAREAGVGEAVIGLTLVAGGTSLPELATSIVAARRGQSALSIGNVVGSNLFNIFGILGICASISPLPVADLTVIDFILLTGGSVVFWLFARTNFKLERWEGAFLSAAYLVYLVWRLANL